MSSSVSEKKNELAKVEREISHLKQEINRQKMDIQHTEQELLKLKKELIDNENELRTAEGLEGHLKGEISLLEHQAKSTHQ